MAARNDFQPPHVEQAKCGDCGHDDMAVDERLYHNDGTDRRLKCKACEAIGVVRVTKVGLSTKGPISFEDASWNQSDDSEESEDNEGSDDD